MTGEPGHAPSELRWDRFSLVEQMASIGSEVDRCIRAWRGGHAREQFRSLFFDPAVDQRSAVGLQRCFLAFAVAARRGR